MKTLLTLIFILSSTLSYSAGTDSGGNSSSGRYNSSSNDPKGSSSNNNVDVNIEYHRAKKLIYKKERLGRNPKTGEDFIISKRYSISFKPSKNLTKSINR